MHYIISGEVCKYFLKTFLKLARRQRFDFVDQLFFCVPKRKVAKEKGTSQGRSSRNCSNVKITRKSWFRQNVLSVDVLPAAVIHDGLKFPQRSEQAADNSVGCDVDFFCGRTFRKSRHCQDCTRQHDDKSRACRNFQLANSDIEIFRATEFRRVV